MSKADLRHELHLCLLSTHRLVSRSRMALLAICHFCVKFIKIKIAVTCVKVTASGFLEDCHGYKRLRGIQICTPQLWKVTTEVQLYGASERSRGLNQRELFLFGEPFSYFLLFVLNGL